MPDHPRWSLASLRPVPKQPCEHAAVTPQQAGDAFALGALLLVILTTLAMAAAIWAAGRNSWAGIIRRLLAHPDRPIVVSLKSSRILPTTPSTWDPSRPLGAQNLLRRSGRGTYRLGPDSLVHLDFDLDDGAGRTLHLVGPIPDAYSPKRSHSGRILLAFLAVPAVVALVTFAVVVLASSGDGSPGLVNGGVAALLAWAVAWGCLRVASRGVARRASKSDSQRPTGRA